MEKQNINAAFLSNPFAKKKGTSVKDIVKNRGILFRNCLIIVYSLVTIVLLVKIFLMNSDIKLIQTNNLNTESEILQVKQTNDEWRQRIITENNAYKNLQKEKSNAANDHSKKTKELKDFKEADKEYEKLNKKLNELKEENKSLNNEIKMIDDSIINLKQVLVDTENLYKSTQNEYEKSKKLKEEREKKNEKQKEEEDKKENEDPDFKSTILTDKEDFSTLSKLLLINVPVTSKLLFRYPGDSLTFDGVHSQIDSHQNILVLIKTKGGPVVGGFTSESWGKKGYTADKLARLFNYSKKRLYGVNDPNKAFYSDSKNVIVFGNGDIFVNIDGTANSQYPQSFGPVEGTTGQIETIDLFNGKKNYEIDTLEIFKLIEK